MKNTALGSISLKFIDIMIGVVLGLGFQWWPNLQEGWQYIAFIFAYVDLVDYWIDYSPSLRRFPPRRELDLLLDVAIIFAMFLYIYSAQLPLAYFLGAYALFNAIDILWLWRARVEYQPTGRDRAFVDTWIVFNSIEILYTLGIILGSRIVPLPAIAYLASFIALRLATRVFASLKYKKVYFI